MKKIYFLLLATILIASCKPGSKTNNRSEGKPVITVTLEPLRYLTEAIAGDRFTVVSMVLPALCVNIQLSSGQVLINQIIKKRQ